MRIWEVERRTTIRPRLFTEEAWAALSEAQRDLIRRQRMAVVAALAEEHSRRYAVPHIVTLARALVPEDPSLITALDPEEE